MQPGPLKRTKVRKGTHSCAECKRRKIKCDRTEYTSFTADDACSQCKARGLASTCKPQYDPRDAPSPEPDVDLRDRVARLESALMSLTGRATPSEGSSASPPRQDHYVGTAIASGTNAATGIHDSQGSFYTSPPDDTYVTPSLYCAPSSSNLTPSTAPYAPSLSPFQAVVDPSLSIEQPPACKWLEENIADLSNLPNKPTSTSSSPPYSNHDNFESGPNGNSGTRRSAYETELLSNLPRRELVDELVAVYFNGTDVCHATFRPVFYQSYNKLWDTPPHEPINVPFLGLLFIAMANAVHCHPDVDSGANSEKARNAMDLYDRLSNQITEDPRYNMHIETVEAVLLQSMFLLNEGKMNNSFLRARIALAIAQMIGLHRDPKVYNAKPLQAERARRLWWKLYDMDRALSMFMGRPYMIHDKFVDVEMPIPYDDGDISEGPDGTMIIDKSKTGKTIMYYRLYNSRVSKDVLPDIIDNNFSLESPDYNKVHVIEARLANLAQTVGPGWNQLLTASDMAAARTIEEQVLWIHRLASTFWTIQIHSSLHMPFIHTRPESKAVCLENARSLMFLYECIRSQFTSPGIRNVVAFYGFASAVFLETMSTLPADRKRVERLKEIYDEDAQKSTIAFQAAQVLEFLRSGGCVGTDRGPSPDLPNPPPIILPYFGIVRIIDKKVNTRPHLESEFNPPKAPKTVALHPPPPNVTIPQVQDDFYAMNMDNNLLLDQPFGGPTPLNWDFNFAMDPSSGTSVGNVGELPMDIDAWSSYWATLNETLLN